MLKFNLKLLKILAYFLHNSIAIRKNIIIFIGSNGSYLAAIKNKKLLDSHFIEMDEKNNLDQYKLFFNKYKKFYIFFLLDESISGFKHESVPILPNLVKDNTIDRFINEHYEDKIIAYNLYDISTTAGEIWHLLVAYTSLQPPLNNLMEYIFQNNLNYGGIYFWSLEIGPIIDKILVKTKNELYNDYFQIFGVITKAGNIKFTIKHHQNILYLKTIPYPTDRPLPYVQGIIEQEISDYLISFKNYLNERQLKICLIFLINEELKTLLLQSNFKEYEVVFILNKEITKFNDNKIKEYSDYNIIELFSLKKNFLGLNNSLKIITKLNFINLLLFKPFIVILLVFIVVLGEIKYQIFSNQRQSLALNKQYFQLAEEYRNIREKYPEIPNVSNIADLYHLQTLLQIPITDPLNIIEKFFNSLNSNIILNKIIWKSNDPTSIIPPIQNFQLNIDLSYVSKDNSKTEALKNLDNYMSDLKKIFPNFLINYTIFPEIFQVLNKRLVIPFTISFSNISP